MGEEVEEIENLYTTDEVGGCYLANGHTHDMTEECKKTAITEHRCLSGCYTSQEIQYYGDGCVGCGGDACDYD